MMSTSDLAEATVHDAVQYSMRKSCKANLIMAGPICSGKLPIADSLKTYFSTVKDYQITLMNQASFYKSLYGIEECEQGFKVDAVESFYVGEFVKKVKQLFETGISSSPYYNLNNWTRGMPEMESRCETEEQKKNLRLRCELFSFHNDSIINVFIGEHAIMLLEDVVPDAIKVYLNTDFDVCMRRRMQCECYRKVAKYKGLLGRSNYYDFVREEQEFSVLPQKEMADIVVKAND